jgi:putative MFS transporter
MLAQNTGKENPAAINARLDRLPATRYIWRLVLLPSLGGCFEFYDLFFTAYIGPGLVRSGIFSSTSASLFGFNGLASFVAATFAGLFIGTLIFSFVADRFGRRLIFACSLLWYTAATVVMAFQMTALSIILWRLIAGIGIGVELVTIDTYITELMPKEVRGCAFAVNQVVQFSIVPVVALLAWLLVPRQPFGFDGWRWGCTDWREQCCFCVVHPPRCSRKPEVVDRSGQVRRGGASYRTNGIARGSRVG